MFNYKGYKLPGDIFLLISICYYLFYYSLLMRYRPMPKILKQLESACETRGRKAYPEAGDLLILDKLWRGCSFVLGRILRSDRPCLRRSLVLYRWCSHHGIKARVIIGVQKENGQLKGHSWLLINESPYREDQTELKKFTTVMEG